MGVTLLISSNTYNLEGIECKDTLVGIDWSTVDCLIFNNSVDSELSTGLELSKIEGIVKKVIYISKDINPLYYCIFTSFDADIYDDEDYLKDKSVLDFLIESYKQTGMTMKSPNSDLETLAKSIATITSSDFDNLKKLVANQFWLKTLNTAVANVNTSLARSSEANSHVVEILSEATKVITNLQTGQQSTSRELENIKKLVDEMEKKSRPNTPFIFSTYNIPVTVPKVLYIKAVGNCSFLNSFILSYQNYLKMHNQYSSKLLFILPKFKYHMARYAETARLAPDTIDFMDLGVSSVYVTYEPKKIVLDTFFNQPSTQVFIVVDLLFGDKLLEGHMVETLYPISSLKDVKRFNLDESRCIVPILGTKKTIVIKYINTYYKENEHARRTLYYQNCQDSFKRIDDLIL